MKIESGHFGVGDFDALGIGAGIELGLDGEAGIGCGRGDQLNAGSTASPRISFNPRPIVLRATPVMRETAAALGKVSIDQIDDLTAGEAVLADLRQSAILSLSWSCRSSDCDRQSGQLRRYLTSAAITSTRATNARTQMSAMPPIIHILEPSIIAVTFSAGESPALPEHIGDSEVN